MIAAKKWRKHDWMILEALPVAENARKHRKKYVRQKFCAKCNKRSAIKLVNTLCTHKKEFVEEKN